MHQLRHQSSRTSVLSNTSTSLSPAHLLEEEGHETGHDMSPVPSPDHNQLTETSCDSLINPRDKATIATVVGNNDTLAMVHNNTNNSEKREGIVLNFPPQRESVKPNGAPPSDGLNMNLTSTVPSSASSASATINIPESSSS